MKKLILIFMLITATAWADSEGPNSPTAAEDQGSWTNPTYIYSSDDNRAEFSDVNQHKLKAYDFDFTIPTDATIDGIKVDIEGQAGNDADKTINVALSISFYNISGDVYHDDLNFKSDATTSFGGEDDTWNASLTEANINSSNFGVLIWDANSTANVLKVDHVEVTIYYTEVSSVTGQVIMIQGD